MKIKVGIMELAKNKASGKLFVILDDNGGPDFLAVTPEGKVCRLERHLFEAVEILDPDEIANSHLLSRPQVDLYAEYYGG